MSAGKIWIIVIALASVVVLVLGWVLGVSPQVQAMVSSQQQRDLVIQENIQHGADLVGLKQQFDEIDVSRRDLEQLRKGIPAAWQQEDVIQAVREIADELQVSIASITWDAATVYAPAISAGVLAPAPAATAEPTDGSTPAPAPPAATVPSEDPNAGIVAVDPADSGVLTGTLVVVPVKISMNVEYPQMLAFMSRLRDSERLILVTGATYPLGGIAEPATISCFVYVVPGPTP